MDMFDFSQFVTFAKIEPGHGALQSILLFMIWWQGRGLRKELSSFRESVAQTLSAIDKRFENLEIRITVLEKKPVMDFTG